MKKTLLSIIPLCVALAACSGTNTTVPTDSSATPTVDYIRGIDVKSAGMDSFLTSLATNYRSYAIYNADTAGDPQMAEIFAQKAVAAFSGELPYPESLDNWQIADPQMRSGLAAACTDLTNALKNDGADNCPEVAAEAQAKFDCWLSSAAAGRNDTANNCMDLFTTAIGALQSGNCKICDNNKCNKNIAVTTPAPAANAYYPETKTLTTAADFRTRDGVVIVNNINIPSNIINPEPVPRVFNQNIYTNGDGVVTTDGTAPVAAPAPAPDPTLDQQYVTRDEFINMMMAMRNEIAAINAKLDKVGQPMTIKVQQIPTNPDQKIMEEVLEIRFDFDRAIIKPEYNDIIKKLAATAQNNPNVTVSVVGYTDRMGTKAYNYNLGAQRAAEVKQMLVAAGIPSSQITTISKGETENAVPTADGVARAENRRVRVVKETPLTVTDAPAAAPMKVVVKNADGTINTNTHVVVDNGADSAQTVPASTMPKPVPGNYYDMNNQPSTGTDTRTTVAQ